MPTFNGSKLDEFAINSTDGSTGEIRTGDVSDQSSIDITPSENETDPEGQFYWTISEMDATLVTADHDILFADTMSSGDTVEDAMVSNTKVFVQLVLDGKTLANGSGSQWFEVRPVIGYEGDIGTNDELLKPALEFFHSDSAGIQSL